jgi:hypothetical protein
VSIVPPLPRAALRSHGVIHVKRLTALLRHLFFVVIILKDGTVLTQKMMIQILLISTDK